MTFFRRHPAFAGALLVCALILFLQTSGIGWNDRGHEMVNRAAAQALPADMPGFLKANAEQLAYLGPEPDRWRERSTEPSLKNAQEPDHFLDLERVDWLRDLPIGRHEFIQRLYERRASVAMENPDDLLPEKVGYQPYIAMETYERLKVAFREYRKMKAAGQPTARAEANAIFYAGWLGHYVADAANPLHTTVHYDGWTGKQNPNGYRTGKGIHWEFESVFLNRHADALKIGSGLQPPTRLANPFQDYMRYLRSSLGEVEKVYQMEKAGAFKEAGTPAGVDYLRGRLTLGAQMLANMWYTAWLESEKMPERRPAR